MTVKYASSCKATLLILLSMVSQLAHAAFNTDLTDYFFYHGLFYMFGTFGMARTYYLYRRSIFLNDEVFAKHRRLWFFMTIIFSLLVSALFFRFDLGFTSACNVSACLWHQIPIWAIIILTVTLAPAIYQNPSDMGIGDKILLSCNLFLFVYPLISILPQTNNINALTIMSAIVVYIIIGSVYSRKIVVLKKIRKTLLFSFTFIWFLLWVAILIYAIFYFAK